MSKTIWKFDVPVVGEFSVPMPVGAQVLSVQLQHGEAKMWVLVDTAWPVEPKRFAVHGTGHPVPPNRGRFIGTFQLDGGSLVFHLFEIT